MMQLLPCGELAGMPALVAHVSSGDDPARLANTIATQRKPGIRVVRLSVDDWGDPLVDDSLAVLSSDPRTSHLVVWTLRSTSEEYWPATPMWTVLDCSGFMSSPMTIKKITVNLQHAPFVPQPTEILVQDPSDRNLVPGLLDALTTTYIPERNAWLAFTSPPDRRKKLAEATVCAASHSWGVRYS